MVEGRTKEKTASESKCPDQARCKKKKKEKKQESQKIGMSVDACLENEAGALEYCGAEYCE